MKSSSIFCLALFFVVNSFSQDIIIAGVGHDFEGNHGLIEIYVKNDINSGQFYVKSYSPSNSLNGYVTLFAPLSAGTSYYISSDDGFYFNPFFGFNPTYGAENVGYINGDDTVTIEAEDFATIIDIYGAKGVNGFGEPWNYSRGWAYRLDGYGPNTTFTLSEWDIHTSEFLNCSGTNASCSIPYPIGSYTLSSNTQEISKLRLLPNPTNKGYVQIYRNDQSLISVQIFDVFGKQLSTTDLTDNKLDVSHLNSGVYFLKISQGNASGTKKLVIN